MIDTSIASAPQSAQERLRDHCRSALLASLEAFARNLGFVQQETIVAFLDEAARCHDELAGLHDRRGFEQAHGLTASRISLVHEHDLEFTLELTALARRLRDYCGGELSRLHLRYMTLLGQSDAAAEQTPVGPETVCRALRALSDAAGFDPEQRLQFLERCGEPLAHALRATYRELGVTLDAAGVAPYRNTPPAPAPATTADGRAQERAEASGEGQRRSAAAADATDDELAGRIAELVQPVHALAERAERREHSLIQATALIESLMSAETSNAIRRFLTRSWLPLLARLHYNHGSDHQQWQICGELAGRLVRSARLPADPQERQQWASGLPALVRKLTQGLVALGLDADARQAALAPCMALHGALIAGETPPAGLPPVPANATLSAPLGANGLRILNHTGYAASSPAPHPVTDAAAGSWLAVDLPDGSALRGCIAWVGATGHMVVLADPDAPQVLVASRRALAELAAAGRCRVLNAA